MQLEYMVLEIDNGKGPALKDMTKVVYAPKNNGLTVNSRGDEMNQLLIRSHVYLKSSKIQMAGCGVKSLLGELDSDARI